MCGKSLELRAIREQMHALPPPAPAGTTIREWFAGLALGNPILMNGHEPDRRIAEAVRIADELVCALAAPRVPTMQSMRGPSDEELREWDAKVNEDNITKERMARETVVEARNVPGRSASRRSTLQFNAILPAPLSVAPSPQQVIAARARGLRSNSTRYVMLGDQLTQDPPVKSTKNEEDR